MLRPDLYVLTNDEHWIMTPEAHKYAAAAGSFCFVTTENGEQQDIYNLTTGPGVQRSLCLNEVIDDSSSTQVEFPTGVGSQTTYWNAVWPPVEKQQDQLYHKQFAEAKQLEKKSWIDNEVFDLVDMRKFKPKNYVSGRWVPTIKTDKQGNFLRAKARWVLRGFEDKQKDYLQTDSPGSTRPGFRMSCQMAASKSWDLFHIDLKTAFLQGPSYDVNRDVVCQLPPEAGHPPKIAARLKKPAYGMNVAPRRWWNILDKALRSCGMVPTRADAVTYCILYSRVSKLGNTGYKRPSHSRTAQKTPSLNHVSDQKWKLHLKKKNRWIPLLLRGRKSINLFVDDLLGTGANDMEQRVLTRL